MWYNVKYYESIKFIKNSKNAILEKEYRKIAKDLNLLSVKSLRFITGTNFNQLVRKIRNEST